MNIVILLSFLLPVSFAVPTKLIYTWFTVQNLLLDLNSVLNPDSNMFGVSRRLPQNPNGLTIELSN